MRVYGRPHVVAPLPGRQPRSSSSVTLQDLRVTILSVPQHHAAVVDEACVQIPVTRQMVGCDGLIADPEVRKGVIAVLDALVS